MQIICPSCTSTYDLPADRIGPAGRKVRCAGCRESWFVAAPAPILNARPPLETFGEGDENEIVTRPVPMSPTISGDRHRAAPNARGRKGKRGVRGKGREGSRGRGSWLAAAAALAALAFVPIGLVQGRAGVVAALPGTAGLYRTVGLPVNLVGLTFSNVRSALSKQDQSVLLDVSGEIVNDGRAPRAVLPLRIALFSETGEALYHWRAKAAEGDLPAGGTVPFRVRLTAPPPAAHRVEVSFVDSRQQRFAARD